MSELENGVTKPSLPILYVIEWKFGYRHEWILTGDEPIYRDSAAQTVFLPIAGYETSDKILVAWIERLIRIFDEGDKVKIEAIKAQLRAFDPLTKKSKTEE